MKQDSTGNVNEVPVDLPETLTREKAVLTRKHFEELEGFLRARDVDAICDRTHRLTRAWCEANRRDPDLVIEFFVASGGFCDCHIPDLLVDLYCQAPSIVFLPSRWCFPERARVAVHIALEDLED